MIVTEEDKIKAVNLIGNLFNDAKQLKSQKTTYTYIMRCGAKNCYKIGISENVEIRHRTLRYDDPAIEVVAVIDKNIETELHNKYKRRRCFGEWFALTPIEVACIIEQYNFEQINAIEDFSFEQTINNKLAIPLENKTFWDRGFLYTSFSKKEVEFILKIMCITAYGPRSQKINKMIDILRNRLTT